MTVVCRPPIDLVVWSKVVLGRLGAPTSANNLVTMVAWARAEGGHNQNSRRYNPLNTTLGMPGATNGGAQGDIKAYLSYADGVTATVNNLLEPRYANIVAALRASDPPATVANLIGSPSPVDGKQWGTSGAHIIGLIGDARAQVAAAGGGTASTGGGTTTDPATTTAANPAANTPTPYDLTNYRALTYDTDDALTVAGVPADAQTEAALISAKLSLSTSEVTQLELTFEDDGLIGIGSTSLGHLGTLIGYGPLDLAIEAVEFGGGTAGTGGVTVTARPAGIAHLRDLYGPQTFTGFSPSDFVALCAGLANLHAVIQPSTTRPSIVVADASTSSTAGVTSKAETYWAACGRLADEVGYLLFEAAGTLFFGKPSWLISIVPPLPLAWSFGDQRIRLDPSAPGGYTLDATPAPAGILTTPVVRVSVDPDTGTEARELTVDVTPGFLRGKWTTGAKAALTGLGAAADGDFLITGIDVDLRKPDAAATLTGAVTPDPTPQPPKDTTGAATDPTAGAGGTGSTGSTGNNVGITLAPPASGLYKCGPGNRWIHPTNHTGHDSRNYGQQRATHVHEGDDIGVPVGTTIYAAHDGTIVSARTHSGYGYAVYIRHSDGLETRYGHLSKFSPGLESSTDNREIPIKAGQVIGWSGGARGAVGAGDSTGPHLHYEVRRNGRAISPYIYLEPDRSVGAHGGPH